MSWIDVIPALPGPLALLAAAAIVWGVLSAVVISAAGIYFLVGAVERWSCRPRTTKGGRS